MLIYILIYKRSYTCTCIYIQNTSAEVLKRTICIIHTPDVTFCLCPVSKDKLGKIFLYLIQVAVGVDFKSMKGTNTVQLQCVVNNYTLNCHLFMNFSKISHL